MKEVPALLRPKARPMQEQELRRHLAVETIRVQVDAVRKRWGDDAIREAITPQG